MSAHHFGFSGPQQHGTTNGSGASQSQDPTHQNALDILQSLCDQSSDERYEICAQLLKPMGARVHEQIYPGGKNLVCTFSDSPSYKKILGAHFDIVPNAPGANDNGASVAELTALALELYAHQFESDELALVLFDNEEIMMKSPDVSGSKQFADFINNNGYKPDEVYVLDVCGFGDVVVISSTAPSNDTMKATIRNALDCSYVPSVEMWTPHSDSTMFGRAGIPALLISTLSSRSLRELQSVQNSKLWNQNNSYPEEWKKLHSSRDNMQSIDPETIGMMIDFLRDLTTSARGIPTPKP